MLQGLQAAFTRFLQLAEEIAMERSEQIDKGECVPVPVQNPLDPRTERMERMSTDFLSFGFGFNSDVHHVDLDTFLHTFLSYDIMSTVASCIALVMFYVAIYRPLILRLDAEIKSVRKLLLLFPDQIARNVLAIADGASGIIAAGGALSVGPGVGSAAAGIAPAAVSLDA
jgi:hypothetical protein